MTNHPHEYLFDIYEKHEKTVCRFVCRHDFCDAVLEGPEVLKRLNATDKLSAAQALGGARDVRAAGSEFNTNRKQDEADEVLAGAFEAYAAARDSKNIKLPTKRCWTIATASSAPDGMDGSNLAWWSAWRVN